MMPASCARAGEVRETADLISFLPARNISTMARYSSSYLWAFVCSPEQYQTISVLNLHLHTSSLKWKKAISWPSKSRRITSLPFIILQMVVLGFKTSEEKCGSLRIMEEAKPARDNVV